MSSPIAAEPPSGRAVSDDGREMYALIRDLYPICRSLTGDGVRQTLAIIGRHIPISVTEVPTGTKVLDWTIPNEWNIRDAFVSDASGRRIIDFHASNLHVVGYSVPVHQRMPLAELRMHLHSVPEHPKCTPYRTAYFRESWGFCLSHEQLASLPDQEYEVLIDATLAPGALSLGECYVPGALREEVLVSAHCCHPSLCNDNLSAIAVATHLAKWALQRERKYSYRFVFAPATLGAITWLALHEEIVPRVRHGLVLACLGDGGGLTYKRSRRGNATIDRVVSHVVRSTGKQHGIEDFTPFGYDERQYCSPGFNLPVGCLMRTPPGRFPEYHTSADDLTFVKPEALADSLEKCTEVMETLESDAAYRNLYPKGEPQLGRRGLYRGLNGRTVPSDEEFALLWVLNGSDGERSLLEIAERSGLPFRVIARQAQRLEAHGLLERRTE